MVEQYRMKAFSYSFYRLLKTLKKGIVISISFSLSIFTIIYCFSCVYPDFSSSLKRQKHEKPASDKRLARQRQVIRFSSWLQR